MLEFLGLSSDKTDICKKQKITKLVLTEFCAVIFADLITKINSPRIKLLYVISKVESHYTRDSSKQWLPWNHVCVHGTIPSTNTTNTTSTTASTSATSVASSCATTHNQQSKNNPDKNHHTNSNKSNKSSSNNNYYYLLHNTYYLLLTTTYYLLVLLILILLLLISLLPPLLLLGLLLLLPQQQQLLLVFLLFCLLKFCIAISTERERVQMISRAQDSHVFSCCSVALHPYSGGAPKERRRGRAEKRLSKRVFLESPFLLCSLKVFRTFQVF